MWIALEERDQSDMWNNISEMNTVFKVRFAFCVFLPYLKGLSLCLIAAAASFFQRVCSFRARRIAMGDKSEDEEEKKIHN